MKTWPITIGLTCAVFLHSMASFAALPVPSPRVCTQFFRSDLVASVRVISSEIFYGELGGGENIYTVELLEAFRGQIDKKFQIRAGLHSARGVLSVGENNLLFAVKRRSAVQPDIEALFIYGGGNAGIVSERVAEIQEIRRVKKKVISAELGNIRGYVYSYPNRNSVNFTFKITSEKHSYQAKKNAEGWFELDVLPGMYKITPESEQEVTSYDLSYDQPEHVLVKAGQCNEVAFRTE